MPDFCMPSLGSDMEDGVLMEWLVKVGDPVERGQIIAVVETQKGAIEIEVFESGEIEALLVSEGTEVPVGSVLAKIRTGAAEMEPESEPEAADNTPVQPNESPKEAPSVPRKAADLNEVVAEQEDMTMSPDLSQDVQQLAVQFAQQLLSLVQPITAAESLKPLPEVVATSMASPDPIPHAQELPLQAATVAPARQKVSPASRRRARELGVSLEGLSEGTGPHGAISLRDIEALAAKQKSQPSATAKLASKTATLVSKSEGGMRQAIGAAMSRSKREIPHYYLGHRVDMQPVMDWLQSENKERSIQDRLIYPVVLLKAMALALKKFPELNGFYRNDRFEAMADIHIGLAIALRRGGLVAPALRNADQKALSELMLEFRDLVNRARNEQLRASEMSAATLTFSNLGDQGVDILFPIITPPQVAIVGAGQMRDEPWVVDGEIQIRPILHLSLSGDHRVSDGRQGAKFLRKIEKLLRSPEKL